MTQKNVYALGDGDRVQGTVDRALLGGDLNAVAEVSRALTRAMELLAASANERDGWTVIFVGGDDILLEIAEADYDEGALQQLMSQFSDVTGGTMSFGVGASVEEAYVNLRRAKSNGTGVLVSYELQGSQSNTTQNGEVMMIPLDKSRSNTH